MTRTALTCSGQCSSYIDDGLWPVVFLPFDILMYIYIWWLWPPSDTSCIFVTPLCQRITDKSWERSGRKKGSVVTPRLQKNVLHMDEHFSDEGEQETMEVQAHVGCTKGEEGSGPEKGGEEAGN